MSSINKTTTVTGFTTNVTDTKDVPYSLCRYSTNITPRTLGGPANDGPQGGQ